MLVYVEIVNSSIYQPSFIFPLLFTFHFSPFPQSHPSTLSLPLHSPTLHHLHSICFILSSPMYNSFFLFFHSKQTSPANTLNSNRIYSQNSINYFESQLWFLYFSNLLYMCFFLFPLIFLFTIFSHISFYEFFPSFKFHWACWCLVILY